MNINILRYSLFGIAGGQEEDHTFVKFIIYPLTIIALKQFASVVHKYHFNCFFAGNIENGLVRVLESFVKYL